MANTRFVTENGLYVTSGNSQFDQTAQFNANLTVSGDLLYVGGNLYVQGTQVIIGGQEYATDLLATIPNLKLGNTTYQWDAYLDNTLVYGDLIPVGNTVLLGNSTNRWVISGNTLNISTTSTLTGAVTLSNTISVIGNATFSNSLAATGNVVLSNTLLVTGAATLSNTLGVTGAATLSNTLGVTGAATLSNTINVTGAATLGNTLSVTNTATFSNTVSITGAATLGNTLSVTNTATFSNTVVITGAANVLSTFGIGGVANALSTLGVTGAATLSNTINVTGAATLGNTLSVTNTASFSNTINVTGAATLSNTINVTGAATLGNTLSVTNTATFSNTIAVTGAATLSNTINVTGAATLGNTLSVTNTATFSNTIAVTGAATLSNTIGVTGAATLSNTLGLTGAATFSNTLAVTGATTLSNTLIVTGNSNFRSGLLFVDAFNSRVGIGNSAPDTGLTVGSSANIIGAVQMSNTLGVTGAVSLGNTLSVTNTSTFSNTTSHIGAATFSNTIGVTGAATLSNTLNVTGAVTFSNTLSVTNTATLSNTLNVTGAATLSNTLGVTGAATLANTIAVTGNATFSKDVLISGNLIVSGTTTYVNTATLNISDNIITLNADVPAITAPTEDAGIEINRGSSANVTLRWNETNDYWEATEDGTNYYRLAVQGAGNTSFDSGVLFVDAVNNRVGINNTAPGVALRVTGAADISSTANVQGNANVGGTFGVSGAANALSTLGVNGATTLASTLAVTGNSTFSANARIEGRLTVNTGGISFGYTAYPIYQTNLDFGSDLAGTWRKIASVALAGSPTTYSTAGFRIHIIDPNANHATIGAVSQVQELIYYVSCNRTNDTVIDTPDTCYVYGPSDHVRAVKTSTGNYEIQVQNKIQYAEYQVVIQEYVQSQNPNAATFFDGSTAGSAGTAQYNATSSTTNIQWVQALRVGNTTTNSYLTGSFLTTSTVNATSNLNVGTYGTTNGVNITNTQLIIGNTTGYGSLSTTATGGQVFLQGQIGNTFSNATVLISLPNSNAAAIELGGTTHAYIDFKTPFADDFDTRLLSNTTGFYIIGGSATSANLVEIQSANVNIDSGVLYVDATNNRVGVNTTTPGVPFEVKGGGGTTSALSLVHPTDLSFVRIVPSASAGAYNPTVAVGDHLLYFSNGTSNYGNLVIAPWSSVSFGMKFNTIGNTITLTANSINMDSGVLYVDGLNNRVGINNTAPGVALRVTGDVDVSATANIQGVLHARSGAISYSQLTIPGSSSSTGEGGQIILGYGNNLASTITGQQNYTYNIDVVGGNTGSTPIMRILAQHGDGTTTGIASFANTGRIHLGATSEQTETTVKITGTANVTQLLNASGNLNAPVVNASSNLNVGAFGTTNGVNVQNTFMVVGNTVAYVNTAYGYVSVVNATATTNVLPTAIVTPTVNATSNLNVGTFGTTNGVNVQNTVIVVGNSTANATHSYNLLQTANSTGTANVNPLGLTVGGTIVNSTGVWATTFNGNVSATYVTAAVVNATSNLNVGTFGTTNGVNVQNTVIVVGNSTANATYSYNLLQTANSTGSANINPLGLTVGGTIANTTGVWATTFNGNVSATYVTAAVVNATSNLNVGTFGTTNGVNVQNTVIVVGNSVANSVLSYNIIASSNSTVNTNIGPGFVNVSSNLNVGTFPAVTNGVFVNTSIIRLGNSSANALINATSFYTTYSSGRYSTILSSSTFTGFDALSAGGRVRADTTATAYVDVYDGSSVTTTIKPFSIEITPTSTGIPLFSTNTLLTNTVALNVVNQTNTTTLYVTTSANVGTALTVNSTVINAAANIAMAAYTEKMASYTIAANGTQDLDLKLASVFKISVGAFTANVRFINPPASGTAVSATLILQYTGTSVLTLQGNTSAGAAGTLKYAYDSAPTLTQSTGKSDIISAVTYDGGATYIVAPSFMNFTT